MLKLNVGFNRKTGEANYGSRGAAVNLELELESSLIGDPDRLKERIRSLFGLAKESVDAELVGQSAVSTDGDGSPTNGHKVGGNGANATNGRRSRDRTRPATASQVRALGAIAERHKFDLVSILTERFGAREASELSITEASSLIDELKNGVNGHEAGGRR